jgi:UDP-3-O-[3-hydroxymyristoyl] glucosamine N-acyltransferase
MYRVTQQRARDRGGEQRLTGPQCLFERKLHKEPVLWYNRSAVDIAHHPKLIHPTAFVAPNATIVGEVHVAARASIWFSSVLRGDNAPIIIGERTNVQDLSMIHVDVGEPCALGVGVIVGHRAVLPSRTDPPHAMSHAHRHL